MPFFPLFTLPFYSPEIFLFSCSPFFNRRFCVLFLSHLSLTSFSSLSQLSFVSPSFFFVFSCYFFVLLFIFSYRCASRNEADNSLFSFSFDNDFFFVHFISLFLIFLVSFYSVFHVHVIIFVVRT